MSDGAPLVGMYKKWLQEWLDGKIGECVLRLNAIGAEHTAAEAEDAQYPSIESSDAVYALRYEYHRTLGRQQAYEEMMVLINDGN